MIHFFPFFKNQALNNANFICTLFELRERLSETKDLFQQETNDFF